MVKCNETFGSFEGDGGWAPEIVCGVPQNVSAIPTLTNFGVLANITPDGWGVDRTKRFGIGNQRITQNRRTSFLGGVGVEFAAIQSELESSFDRVLGSVGTGVWANHLDTFFMEFGLNRATATVKQVRFLLNRCKTNVFGLALALDEPVVITENILAQYIQKSPTADKNYAEVRYDPAESGTKIYDAMEIGASPVAIAEDMLMFNDCNIDLIEDPLGSPVTVPLTDVSDFSMEINRNLDPRRGIRKGNPIAYEHAEKTANITCTLTKDFADADEYDRMIANELFDIELTLGTLVTRLVGGKWERPPPAITDEDLVAESMNADFGGFNYTP